MLHPWAGLIFFCSVWYMYVMWAPQMRSTDTDKQWWKAVKYYSTNQDDKMPPAGRYNAGQKFLFWGFFWSTVALLLTGLVLWFPEYIPWNLRFLRYLSVLIHPAAALFTIGLFMIHLYMGLFASAVRLDPSSAVTFRLRLPSAITLRGIKKSSASLPRRANDAVTNRFSQVRRADSSSRDPEFTAFSGHRVPRLLQTHPVISQTASRKYLRRSSGAAKWP